MARYGFAITKRVSFRGVQQEFTNVYYYEAASTLTVPNAQGIVNTIKTAEVQFHGSDVTFVRYAVWRADGSPGTNIMLDQGTLSGVGGQVNNASQDRERAVLIRWPAGIDIRGKPVYLRKWYHSCGSFAGVPFSSGILQNTSAIASGDRSTIAGAANALRQVIQDAVTWNLVAKSGRSTSGVAECHAYLEHHQLGDAWRG